MPIRGSSLFQTCTVKLNPGTVASKHGDKKSFHQKKKHDSFRYLRIKTIVLIWSEWRDLNSRPLDPQSSALPTAPHPVTTLFIIQYSKGKCKPFFKKICFFPFFCKRQGKKRGGMVPQGPRLSDGGCPKGGAGGELFCRAGPFAQWPPMALPMEVRREEKGKGAKREGEDLRA